MFERFTKAARAVVTDAERCAREQTAGEVRPEHLLAALLQQQDTVALRVLDALGAPAGRVLEELEQLRLRHVDGLDADDAEALRAIGIDLDEVVRRIDRNLGGLTEVAGRGRRPRFSREARRVLELALREAVALKHGYLGTEHLLLGLSRAGDRVVADTLAACGLDHAGLRAAVVDALHEA